MIAKPDVERTCEESDRSEGSVPRFAGNDDAVLVIVKRRKKGNVRL